MRRFFSLLLLPVLLLPALTLLSLSRAALADEAPAADSAPPHHARLKLEQRFAQANVAHDGHLTLEEAKAGFPDVARHFHSIDVDGKGFVTESDVRSWRALRKAASHLSRQPDGDPHPQNADQRVSPDQKPIGTGTLAQVSSGQ